VKVGTPSFADTKACERILGELKALCISENICNISKLTGTLGQNNG
jgi:hypothetical protein